MNNKFTSIIIIFSLILVIPIANAQLTLGGEASQESIEVKMNIEGEVSVKHVVRASNTGATLLLFDNAVIPDKNYNALNEIGATPKDLISIIEALKESGALIADIEII